MRIQVHAPSSARSGWLWDQHVRGIYENSELILDFPHWNQLFTADFTLQAQVKNGELVGRWRLGLLYGSCRGNKANY